MRLDGEARAVIEGSESHSNEFGLYQKGKGQPVGSQQSNIIRLAF